MRGSHLNLASFQLRPMARAAPDVGAASTVSIRAPSASRTCVAPQFARRRRLVLVEHGR
jgi:hypothetical protein